MQQENTTPFVRRNPRVKLNLAQLLILVQCALASSPKGEEEERLQEYANLSTAHVPGAVGIINELEQLGLIDENQVVTPFGMKCVLNGTQPTPNFDRLANQDHGTAVKMLSTAQKALEEMTRKNKDEQIIPTKNTELVETIIRIGEWCQKVTTQYRQSLEAAKTPAAKTKKAATATAVEV